MSNQLALPKKNNTIAGSAINVSNKVSSKFEWTVENFQQLIGNFREIRSPKFSSDKDTTIWSMKIIVQDGEEICLYLLLESTNLPSIEVKFTLSVLDVASKVIVNQQWRQSRYFAESSDIGASQFGYGADPFVLKSLFKDGYFKEECIIRVHISHLVERINKCRGSLQEDFGRMLQDNSSSDTVINIGSSRFAVHKIILMARSPVFCKMFTTEMKEKSSNEVKIMDIKASVFENFLRFVYTGECDFNCDTQLLLKCADKYHVPQLVKRCTEHLIANLNLENVLECLLYSDIHLNDELKDNCIKYIIANMFAVRSTDRWREFLVDHYMLALEIYETEHSSRYEEQAVITID